MTENFSNETIDFDQIPKIDSAKFKSINKNYYKVILINLAITFVIIALSILLAYYFITDFYQHQLVNTFGLYGIALGVAIVFSNISFKKKQFAFREQDVLFKSGILATNVAAVPINRIQHVSLHEGWISRIFGLVTIKVFTASNGSGDLVIPGIEKEKAEDIKFLLMGKISNEA